MVGRVHKDGTISGVESLPDQIHGERGLHLICEAADDCPALRIEPEVGLRCRALADGFARFGEAAKEAVFVPAKAVDLFLQRGLCFLQRGKIACIFLLRCKSAHDCECIVKLQRHKAGFSICTKAETVVPVGIQTGGKPMGAEMGF